MIYAIAFDLDLELLQQSHPAPSATARYDDICKLLEPLGFSRVQDTLYFGGVGINAVTCVLAVQKLSREYVWFKNSVRDIRMLRIEEVNDMKPAL